MGYYPEPKVEPIAYPRIRPRIDVPSGLGDEGLVANYLFYYAKGGTHLHDFSPKNNHGTLYGRPKWVDERYGWALKFNGVDNYVEVPIDTSLQVNNPATWLVWIKSTSNDLNDWYLSTYGDSSSYEWILRMNSGEFQFFSRSSGTWHASGKIINDGSWHLTAVTVDSAGTTLKMYVDGDLVKEGSISFSSQNPTSQPVNIGADAGSGYYVACVIGGVCIYNVAKSASWIKQRFERTKGIFGI